MRTAIPIAAHAGYKVYFFLVYFSVGIQYFFFNVYKLHLAKNEVARAAFVAQFFNLGNLALHSNRRLGHTKGFYAHRWQFGKARFFKLINPLSIRAAG